MQTQKINPLPVPATTPRALPPAKAEGGQLFASELDRASGGDGVMAHRNQREAGDMRRAEQANRAEANDQTRAEAREGREAGDRTRKEKRSERLDASGAQAETPQLRPPVRQAEGPSAGTRREPIHPAALDEPNPEAEAPEKAKGEGAQAQPGGLTAAALLAAGLASSQAAALGAQRPDVANAQQTKVATARVAGTDAPQTNTEERGGETRSERTSGPKTAPRAASDAMGELLLEREAELDRQAQVLRQVQTQLGPNARELTMQLSPASLGKIQIRLALRAGRLTAVMRASERESLDALENQIPELTASLEAQGFDVVDFDLGLMSDPGTIR